MKKLLIFALMAMLGWGLTNARDKKDENIKTTTFVTDIHCENCSTKVMNNVPALGKGIKDVTVDVAQKTVTVTYDTRKNNDEKIIGGLRSLNVNAQAKHECDGKNDCCADKKDGGTDKKDCCKDK